MAEAVLRDKISQTAENTRGAIEVVRVGGDCWPLAVRVPSSHLVRMASFQVT